MYSFEGRKFLVVHLDNLYFGSGCRNQLSYNRSDISFAESRSLHEEWHRTPENIESVDKQIVLLQRYWTGQSAVSNFSRNWKMCKKVRESAGNPKWNDLRVHRVPWERREKCAAGKNKRIEEWSESSDRSSARTENSRLFWKWTNRNSKTVWRGTQKIRTFKLHVAALISNNSNWFQGILQSRGGTFPGKFQISL